MPGVPRSPSQINRPRTLGRKSGVFVSLLPKGNRVRPEEQTLVLQSNAAKNATSITLTSGLLCAVPEGQYLSFRNTSTDQEYLLRVGATANSGANTLTVAALPEAIPAATQAKFPPEFVERTAADLTENLDLSETKTFNTGGFRDGIITGGSYDINLPGVFWEFCPVYNTLAEQAKEGREFWVAVEYDPPKENWRGRVVDGVATFTSRSQNAPVDGFITADIQGGFMGKPNENKAYPL